MRDFDGNEAMNEKGRGHGENNHHEHRPLNGQFQTSYSFIPDIEHGWTPPNPAPAWYPGGGGGALTQLGNCATFFNQYASLGPAGLTTVGAPVNQFFSSQLGLAGLQVPAAVTTIFYTSSGKSIWCQAIGASSTQPVSPTRIEFITQLKIIGGTGRFHSAEGQASLKGFFNPQNTEDAGFTVDGWIEY